MVKNLLLVGILLLACAGVVNAQEQQKTSPKIKIQLFGGISESQNRATQRVSQVPGGGFAILIPLNSKLVSRNFISGSKAYPPDAKSFTQLQTGSQLGYKILGGKITVLGGAGETFQYRQSGTTSLFTGFFGANFKLKGRWGLLTPVSVNSRAISIGVNLSWIR